MDNEKSGSGKVFKTPGSCRGKLQTSSHMSRFTWNFSGELLDASVRKACRKVHLHAKAEIFEG